MAIDLLPNYIAPRIGDGITSLISPYTTFFSEGRIAPRSKAMDQNLQNIIRDQIATTGKTSGVIGYSDFDKSQVPGTEFPDADAMLRNLATGKMSLAEFANATTQGRMTYDVDPNTGKVTFGSTTYNFRPEVADRDDIFGYFAKGANERNIDIAPNITIPADEVRGFARDFSDFGKAKMGGARQPSSFRSMNNPNVYEGIRSLGMDDDEFEEMLAEATRKGQGQNFLSRVAEFLPGGPRSLSGGIARGVGSLIRNIAPASYGTSGRFYNSLTPQGKAAVNQIYGSGGIMSGYNPVSAFGRGAVGAIDQRIANIANRRAPQTAASRQRARDLFAAREKIMQTKLDSDNRYTGPKSSPRGQKKGVMDDDPFGGTSGTTGGSKKIVCTMMNESYGFGNFRNKIWMKFHKDLSPEYQKGYHKIFLPLVKFAKGKGKLNKVVKKTLEHIAVHSTIDMRQSMKGKKHLLGRLYRKIILPICYWMGKK